jgi:hypothetical protein
VCCTACEFTVMMLAQSPRKDGMVAVMEIELAPTAAEPEARPKHVLHLRVAASRPYRPFRAERLKVR